jgi:hypothetical protein
MTLRKNKQAVKVLTLRKLEFALKHARMDHCGVEKEHQDAMRLYLDSWVVDPLVQAIGEIKGELGVEEWYTEHAW